jgi:hypothetical protein
MIYLDESGTSVNESITVVAGVIVDADKQWKSVESYIGELIDEYVPIEHQSGFVFHAKELFHGTKVFASKTKYPPARRIEILRKLVGIPLKFSLPTVYGYSDKTHLPSLKTIRLPKHKRSVLAVHHAVVYSSCALASEIFMREHARPEEIAALVAEDNEIARSAIKLVHHTLRGKIQPLKPPNFCAYLEKWMRRIICLCVKSSIASTLHQNLKQCCSR